MFDMSPQLSWPALNVCSIHSPDLEITSHTSKNEFTPRKKITAKSEERESERGRGKTGEGGCCEVGASGVTGVGKHERENLMGAGLRRRDSNEKPRPVASRDG